MPIRPIAICAARLDDRLLGFDVPDSDGSIGFRPLGGGIEPGELARDTIVREILEETGQQLTGVRQLGVLENIFTYRGQLGHEVVFVFDGRLSDETYAAEPVVAFEDNGEQIVVRWRKMDDFRSGRVPLYPDGLLPLLDAQPESSRTRVEKVIAYIVHDGRLAVFVHTGQDSVLQAGIQVPKGTVQPGESIEAAVLREAVEETGLDGLQIAAYLGTFETDAAPYRDELWTNHVFQLRCAVEPPERWTHLERGSPGEDFGDPIPFGFSWVPLAHGGVISGSQGHLLSRVRRDA